MNRKRNIIILSAIGILALGLTTGWSVLAGAAWPPEPMPVYSLAGTWGQTSVLDPGEICPVTISPEDPMTGKGSFIVTDVNQDFTQGGAMAGADSWTPWLGTYIRTGPNTWQNKAVCYVKKNTQPRPTLLFIMVLEGTWTMTAPDAVESLLTLSIYLPSQLSMGDGLPDEGQKPIASFPTTQYMKPL